MVTQQTSTCVFYDGACPLCRREINHYKKLVAGNSQEFDIAWIDINKSQLELDAEGINYEDAMRIIHIKDASGVHQVGIEAIFSLWDKLPYYQKLSSILKKCTFLHPVLATSYALFAKHRLLLTGRRYGIEQRKVK